MLFEVLPLPFDDNLKIPIASATAMTILIGLN
jgi:dolichol kinase